MTTLFADKTDEQCIAESISIITQHLCDIPPKTFQILLFIASRTHRFKKTHEAIPLRHFTDGVRKADGVSVQAGVGLAKNAVLHGLQLLEEAGIISVTRGIGNKRTISINLNVIRDGISDKAREVLRMTKRATTEAIELRKELDVPASRMRLGKKERKAAETYEEVEEVTEVATSRARNSAKKVALPRKYRSPDRVQNNDSHGCANEETGGCANEESSFSKLQQPIKEKLLNLKRSNRSNGGEPQSAVLEAIAKAEKRSEEARQRKSAKAPKHTKAMNAFIDAIKEDHPSWKSTGVSTAAIRNLRLVTESMSTEEAINFAVDTYRHWSSMLSTSMSWLLKHNPHAATVPNADTFGINARRFHQALQDLKLISDTHSRPHLRATAPATTRKYLPPVEQPESLEARLRRQVKEYDPAAPQPAAELGGVQPAQRKYDGEASKARHIREVEEYARLHGITDFEEAEHRLTFGD